MLWRLALFFYVQLSFAFVVLAQNGSLLVWRMGQLSGCIRTLTDSLCLGLFLYGCCVCYFVHFAFLCVAISFPCNVFACRIHAGVVNRDLFLGDFSLS